MMPMGPRLTALRAAGAPLTTTTKPRTTSIKNEIRIQFVSPCQIYFTEYVRHICYLQGGRSVWEKTVPKVLSTARGRRPRAVLKTKDTVFSHTDRLSPVNTEHVYFFPAVNWLYRLQIGLFTQLLSFNGLARRLPTICKKILQRTSNSDSRQKKDVLKIIRFSNYFMLAVFISLIKFSKIVFCGVKFRAKFEVLL